MATIRAAVVRIGRGPLMLVAAGLAALVAAAMIAATPTTAMSMAGGAGASGSDAAVLTAPFGLENSGLSLVSGLMAAPHGDAGTGAGFGRIVAHHASAVTLSTMMQRRENVVASVLLQGPDPSTGRPGWSRCVALPQSGPPTWADLPVRLAFAADYIVTSYDDFACTDGQGYRGSVGTISTRFAHWIVSASDPPRTASHAAR
ncbi:hypothetical protein [Microbacterium hominis]|nr:hypothetical protein [Microbacterium hominis]